MTAIPPEAVAVLQEFLDASLRKDEPAMRACLSKKTLEGGTFSGSGPENVTFTLGAPAWEGDAIVVPVTGTPNDPAEGRGMELPAVLIQEAGAWKFDLATSMDRMMGGSMKETMEGLANTMSQAAGAIGSAFAEGMSEAFGDSSDKKKPPIPDWDLVPLVACLDEVCPLPELVTLPKLSAALSESIGSEVVAEAAMKDLLQQVASDQEKVLLDWFEDQLFAGWGDLFAEIARTNPLAGRLRAVRIESAAYHDQRFVALDGNDLVYRIFINDQAGYYSDDELATILPGVVAGLPHEINPALAGHRFLPSDGEYPLWSIYKERIVPRHMRRISDLLGKPIRLEADFDDVYDNATAARQLFRWGINRVYGALALACLDDELRLRLADTLHTIRLKMTCGERVRFASLENGVFEVGVRDHLGERGCFYEYQLLGPLTGEPIVGEAADADDTSLDESDNDGEENGGEADPAIDVEDESLLGLTREEEASKDEASDEKAADEPALTDAERNRELFATAVESMRQNGEPAWRQQLELALGRPVGLTLDYDALCGNHDLLMPFIHQSLTAGLGGVSILGFDPNFKPRLAPVQEVFITLPAEDEGVSATFEDGVLRLAVPMEPEGPPAVEPVAAAIRAVLGGDAPVGGSKTGGAGNAFSGGGDWIPASQKDLYKQAAAFMDELQKTMKTGGMWPGDKPDGEIEIRGAFGSENMAFEQWLAWVLIPRVRDVVLTRGDFPKGSNVAAYAARQFDGAPHAGGVLDVLARFDEFVNTMPPDGP
jgi:uncharacterized protein YqcC (DUF446 family)